MALPGSPWTRTGPAYVAGETQSPDFPITPSAPRREATLFDSYAAKLDPGGTGLLYSTYLGGDGARGLVLGPGREASVTGATFLDNLTPGPGAMRSMRDSIDGYIITLATDGTRFVYGSYIGAAEEPAVDPVSGLPEGPALTCEAQAASQLGRLARALARCHARLARAMVRRAGYDSAACEARARGRYDTAGIQLSDCPACVAANRPAVADRVQETVRAFNAESYRAGTRLLGSQVTGFVPPTRRVLRCENELARSGAALLGEGFGCERDIASGVPTCPSDFGGPFPLHLGKLFRLRRCPFCLRAAVPAVKYRAGALVKEAAGKIFCGGTPLP